MTKKKQNKQKEKRKKNRLELISRLYSYIYISGLSIKVHKKSRGKE
jgi:hypothetical protein